MIKKCSKCKIFQDLDKFSKDKSRHDGLNTKCKECNKNNYLQNREHKILNSKINRNNNRAKYRKTVRKRYKERIKEDNVYKIRLRITCMIRESLKSKKSKSSIILGYSFKEFKDYIQSKFEPWMNWDNYGNIDGKSPTAINQCWDLDHIIPLSSARTEEDIYNLNHYTNLQPLCSFTNRWLKRDNYEKDNNWFHCTEILV